MNPREMVNAYLNWEKQQFPVAGRFGIPVLPPVQVELKGARVKRLDYAVAENTDHSHDSETILHCFADDWVFVRVWNEPEEYLKRLQGYRAVIAPDFSIYTDFPHATQVFNHFRKHWLGAYWSAHGITVIPDIRWITDGPEGSDFESMEWSLSGEPTGSTVAFSPMGAMLGRRKREGYVRGYWEAIRRLDPSKVLVVGGDYPELRVTDREYRAIQNDSIARMRASEGRK